MFAPQQISQLVLPNSIKMLRSFDAKVISEIIFEGGVALLKAGEKEQRVLEKIRLAGKFITKESILKEKTFTKEEFFTLEIMRKKMDHWVREISSHSHPQRKSVDLIRSIELIDRNGQTPKKEKYGYEPSCLPHLDSLARVNCIISSGGGVLFYPRKLIMKLIKELEGKQFSGEELKVFHEQLKQSAFQVDNWVYSFHAGLFRDQKNNIICGALHSSPFLPEHAKDIRLRIMSYSLDKANSISNEELFKWLSKAI